MKYWLETQRVDLHKTHGDFIGCRMNSHNPGNLEGCSVNFKKMNKGDRVVVCSRSGDLVFGVYKITSDGFALVDDPEWGSAYCYKLKLELGREPYPSFKEFKEEFKKELEFTKDTDSWEGSSVGWVRQISKGDYDIFGKYLTMPV
jgi:hypothetical protein